MTTRDIFILALRVLGFWMLLRAVGLLAYALAMTCQLLGVSSGNSWPEYGLIDVLVTAWLPILIQCIAACVLFRYATNIVSLFYGQAECAEETPPVISITESGMYRVTSRLLGVYACWPLFLHYLGPSLGLSQASLYPGTWPHSSKHVCV